MTKEEYDREVWALIRELEIVTQRLRDAAEKASEHGWLTVTSEGDKSAQ